MAEAKDYSYLIGTQLHRWTVHSIHKRAVSGRKRVMAKATCECGSIKSVIVENMVRGHSKSCGCRPFPYKRKNCVVVGLRDGKFDGFCTCGREFKAKSKSQVAKGLCCFKPSNKGVRGKYDFLGLPKYTLRVLHNRWRAMRQRIKHDGVELEPSWHNFVSWVKDVGVPSDLTSWFMRFDVSTGWVKGNCGWHAKGKPNV